MHINPPISSWCMKHPPTLHHTFIRNSYKSFTLHPDWDMWFDAVVSPVSYYVFMQPKATSPHRKTETIFMGNLGRPANLPLHVFVLERPGNSERTCKLHNKSVEFHFMLKWTAAQNRAFSPFLKNFFFYISRSRVAANCTISNRWRYAVLTAEQSHQSKHKLNLLNSIKEKTLKKTQNLT